MEQIMETGAILLRSYICDQIGRGAKYIAELALEWVSQDPHIKKLLKVLKRMAQEVDKDKKLQRLMGMDRAFTLEGFTEMACHIFSDGITWDRVALFFYVVSKVALKAVIEDKEMLINPIVGWALGFLRKRLLTWIQEQGGWDGLLSQHSNQIKWLAVAVAVAFIAVAVAIIPKQQLPWIQEPDGWDGLLSKHEETLKWTAGGADTLEWMPAVAMAIGTGLLALVGLRRT
ncbi:apoptosis regulator BAX-like [Talpa occidentalis]|uniref:apoptosis regulator BAX-like n=1 Tax=Talpa occidentalis TaxID=50954 RepID=UPI00188DEE5B|nr:apoptosis regulator BAX-like [Talpa occidentalis]XP_054553257.1 apoptosis regulator BAX-like [Talpa occidentalis]